MASDLEARRWRGLRSAAFALGLGATLALLLAHAWHQVFVTDDAYISFRYARNLVDGHGLVFNPGHERVEGYTNFLWVVALASLHALGIPMEAAALSLSALASIALWACVAGLAWRLAGAGQRVWILLPLLLLALTRSVAVWSSGGLETRLFEALVVAGTFRLLIEDERLAGGARQVWPLAATLFALASLTRPDGLLVTACAFAALAAWRARELAARARWLAASALAYAAPVGAHLAFRYLYYGAWLPNTYYAKVGGRLWWGAGIDYLCAFALEYGIWLWLPFLVAGVVGLLRRRAALVPLLFGAVVLPHALYVASIGGDHFEFRPLDLYFPFAYLLLMSGALWLARGPRSRVAVASGLALVAWAVVELPWRSGAQFPSEYQPAFPGAVPAQRDRALLQDPVAAAAHGYLDPERTLLYRLPGLRSLASWHRSLIRSLTQRYVGIRREEHVLFLEIAREEGRRLAELVAQGRIPRDAHLALDCVGAIPYYSDLRVLDRLGLTDARVARGPFARPDVMAHGKQATLAYAREAAVDLWAVDPVHLLWAPPNPPRVERMLWVLLRGGPDAYAAPLGGGRYLLAILPAGIDAARARFPALSFRSARDPQLVRELALALPPETPGYARIRETLARTQQALGAAGAAPPAQ
jgi:arabinofuranosyltransferase